MSHRPIAIIYIVEFLNAWSLRKKVTMSTVGRIFVFLYGESHGKAVGVVIDGCPAVQLTEGFCRRSESKGAENYGQNRVG